MRPLLSRPLWTSLILTLIVSPHSLWHSHSDSISAPEGPWILILFGDGLSSKFSHCLPCYLPQLVSSPNLLRRFYRLFSCLSLIVFVITRNAWHFPEFCTLPSFSLFSFSWNSHTFQLFQSSTIVRCYHVLLRSSFNTDLSAVPISSFDFSSFHKSSLITYCVWQETLIDPEYIRG